MQVKADSISILIEWTEVTTAHGFFDFVRAKTIIGKFIWFILILFSMTIMCNQVYHGVRVFISHEWKASIQEVHNNVDGGVPMPSIIACNVNRFKYSKTKEYNMTLDMVQFLFLNMIAFNRYLLPSSINKTAEQDFIKWRKSNNFSLDDIYERLGPSLLDMIPSGEQDQQNFHTIYTTEYGKCIMIDININSTRVGSKGGTVLIFDTQGWDYLPLVENNYILEGLAVQVTYDRKAEVGKWIMLHPRTYVAIGIQIVEKTVRAVDESIGNPLALLNAKPPCERHPKMPFIETEHYSMTNCIMDCSWLIPMNLCNCSPLEAAAGYPQCDVEQYFSCFGFNESSLETGSPTHSISPELQQNVSKCERKCEMPCYTRYAEATVSHAKFPSDSQTALLERSLARFGIVQKRTGDAVAVDIHFSSLATKTIELYEVMSFDNLISSSGGLMGLWAGMSFLTIFQAISYFYKYIETCWMGKSTSA